MEDTSVSHNLLEVADTSASHNQSKVGDTSASHNQLEVVDTSASHNQLEVVDTSASHNQLEVASKIQQNIVIDTHYERQGNRTMQDFSTIIKIDNTVFMVVLDGNGIHGHIVAEQALLFLKKEIIENKFHLLPAEEFCKILPILYNNTDSAIKRYILSNIKYTELIDDVVYIVYGKEYKQTFSGASTLTLIRKEVKKDCIEIVSSNIGDSTAAIYNLDTNSPPDKLTVDHDCECDLEQLRILENKLQLKSSYIGGSHNSPVYFPVYEEGTCTKKIYVDKLSPKLAFRQKDVDYNFGSYFRSEFPNYEVTIACSRLLGCYHGKKVGITNEPSVGVTRVPLGTNSILIVASDGLWNIIGTKQHSTQCIKEFMDECIKEKITDECINKKLDGFVIKQLKKTFGVDGADDISIIIASL